MPPETVGLSRVTGRGSVASENVGANRDGFKMQRITARRTTAEMVDLESMRNRSDEEFVGDSVGISHQIADSHDAVSRTPVSGPNPASSVEVEFDPLKQALFEGPAFPVWKRTQRYFRHDGAEFSHATPVTNAESFAQMWSPTSGNCANEVLSCWHDSS